MKIKGLILCALIVLLSVNGIAQDNEKRFGIELNSGASLATRKLGDANLKTGLGFEGLFHYRFMPYTGVFAGWGWNKFAAGTSFAGKNMDFVETGYVFGLQFNHPIVNTAVSYYLRAGGLYNHIEIENVDGDITKDTGHGLGWQLAGGVDILLGDHWSFISGVKFNSLSGQVPIDENKMLLDLNYLSVRLGIIKKF